MIPVDQKIMNLKTGDCFRACLASILEVNLDGVPNFLGGDSDKFNEHLQRFCEIRGLRAISLTIPETSIIKDCYVIASGSSPRDPKNYNHAVVYFNGKMIHDPHPSKLGIVGKPKSYTIFAVRDLSLLLDIPRSGSNIERTEK